jgi:hypothetical protein
MEHFIYKNDDGSIIIDPNRKLILTLNSDGKRRNIGVIAYDKRKKIGYFKEEKERDAYHKMDAWSLNWSVLSWLPDDDCSINIKSETAIYRITKSYAIACGQFLYHKQSGIEKKLYVPKRYWKVEPLATSDLENLEKK